MTTAALDQIAPLVDLLRGRSVVVLAGAGCSTESGIPDYRGPEGTLRARQPMQFGEFVRSAEGRARYWSRSSIGWSRVAGVRPNAAHLALARLEESGAVRGIITQNVDGLHQRAGSRRVVELHGSLAAVVCLGCGWRGPRDAFQERLKQTNARWFEAQRRRAEDRQPEPAPDGDALLADREVAGFQVPGCPRCDGVVKPDVVFFGENVPPETVARAWALFEEGDVLLVVGSSLTVYSGRRFVYRAQKEGMPIGVVNLGTTRADEVAAVKVDGRLGEVLPRVAEEMTSPGGGGGGGVAR